MYLNWRKEFVGGQNESITTFSVGKTKILIIARVKHVWKQSQCAIFFHSNYWVDLLRPLHLPCLKKQSYSSNGRKRKRKKKGPEASTKYWAHKCRKRLSYRQIMPLLRPMSVFKACAASRAASSNGPLGKPIRGMIISLPAGRTRLCQVLEGSGWVWRGGRRGRECSVMWHSRVWHRSPVERGPKAPLGKWALCGVRTDGRGSERLTFPQGLWPLDWPIIRREIHE